MQLMQVETWMKESVCGCDLNVATIGETTILWVFEIEYEEIPTLNLTYL